MSEIHGNPTAMRDFARALNQFCLETSDRLAGLRSRLQELGSSEWTDENFRRFAEQFDPANQTMVNVLEHLELELAAALAALADRYEELLHE